MKILVVEDEIYLRKAIVAGLKKFGYAVDFAANGEDALENILVNFYDAIILDLNLPLMDGIDVLKELRKHNDDVKVLILSARTGIEDIIQGLDVGANDYLVKPFHFKILEARLRALLRRKFVQQDVVIKIGDLSLDTAKKTVSFKDEQIRLTKKEYSIFEYLAVNKDKIISSEELIEHIWDSDVNFYSNSFKVHLNALKNKLSRYLGEKEIIKNVRGLGYFIDLEKKT